MIGKTISHYKILEKLGEGGMGVVYKAEDTKLKRTVALKFLPSQALKSEEEKSRFIREAQAAAALSHPNIATVYEIDEVEGKTFIAMEYVEGQSLKEKIESGPLKIEEAIKIAQQIANGLQAAHEKGIIHRDIKSANVMVTRKGEAKIMDFGLAKMLSRSLMTKVGTTLGTIAYMSPEQASGEPVDYRTDIWSLGVVLYEMTSGQLPFKGEYEQAIIYSILNEEPEPLTALRTGVPLELERIVNKLIAKDPAARYQHVDELPVDLKAVDLTVTATSKISFAKTVVQTEKQSASWLRAIPWSITILIAIVALITIWLLPRSKPSLVKRSNIVLPESAPIAPIGSAPLSIGRPALALSPDGTNFVYVADIGGNTQLYLRPMNQFEATPIPGTEGAYHPFFSPDGHWVGFFVGSEMKKISILGGAPVPICEAVNSYGASWGPQDRIVFSPNEGGTLSWISAVGGTPQVLTEERPRYTWPEILPGGKAVLVSGSESSGIRVIFLDSGEEKTLIVNGENPRYLPTGYLVYTRDGRLQAAPFNLVNLKVTGTPVPILDNVRTEAPWGATQCTISNDGTLVYLLGLSEATSTLVWVDRRGSVEQLQFPVETYGTFQLSPDGQRLAIQVQSAKWNIWIYNLVRGSRSKLTLEGNNMSPIWTPDGKWVTFTSDRTGPYNLFMKSADGSGEIKQLAKNEITQHPYAWSPDGKLLAFTERTQAWDILLISINGKGKLQPFANTRFAEWGPTFSPDDQWIAYVSDEQGQYDVYVQPYPQTGERWRVSTEGGEEPVWSPNSNELFYRNGRKWMVVAYTTTPKFSTQVPQVLFEGDYINVGGRSYDVSPDDQRFLLLKSSEESMAQTQLNVVVNWFEELKRKVPSKN